MLITPVFERLRWIDDCGFKTSLGYIKTRFGEIAQFLKYFP